jgi:L-ascorbate metabolism protein UlaG (beta-lactamase superfamily)
MAKITNAEPPFDKVDIILATQSHGDHFSPDLVAKYMDKNKGTAFLSNDEAASHVRAYIKDFASAAQRIKALFPMDGEKTKETILGVKIQAMSFPISQDSYITNLGFLVNVGGKKFLHMGDSAGPLEYLKVYKLSKEKIDVAFIPYWYFADPNLRSAIEEGIKAKHVVPMLFGLQQGSIEQFLKALKSEFPEAILFLKELDSKTIQ